MIETVAVALACLGTIVTGFGTAWLWVEYIRLERRIDRLEILMTARSEATLEGLLRGARSLSKGEAVSDLRAKTS